MPEENQAPDSGLSNGPEEQPLVRVPAETDTENGTKSNLLLGVGVIVVIALIVIGLWLPPISLPERLGLIGGQEEATAVPQPTPTEEIVETTPALPDGVTVSSAATVSVQQVSSDAFFGSQAAAAATPPGLTLTGDVYTLAYEGEAPTGQIAFSLPANAGDERALDLYGWNGSQWQFMASQIDPAGRQVASHETSLPQAVALMQAAAPELPAVATTFGPEQDIPVELLPHLAEVAVGPLYLESDGDLSGTTADLPTGAYSQLLHVTNVQSSVDQAAVVALLSDEAIRSAHMEQLLAAVDDYAGLNIDYQGVPSGQRDAFTAFVTEVAEALHSEGKTLALTLGTPNRTGEIWEMGGHDWARLGQIADTVYVKLPLSPAAYGDGGEADQLLQWATRYVDRYKLNALVSGMAVELFEEHYLERSNQDALTTFGSLEFVDGDEEVEPGTPITVALSGTASPFEWDGSSLTYSFTYENDDQTHTVWLGNEAAVSHRLRLADRYHLRGVTVTGLGTVANGPGYAAALESYLSGTEAPQPAGAAIAWTVRDEEDGVIASASGNELSFSWEGSEEPGSFLVTVEFALGEAVLPLDNVTIAFAESEEEELVEEEGTPAQRPVSVGDADAVVNAAANVRTGPGLSYGTLAGGAAPGTRVTLIGRNSDSSWLNVILPDDREGWILASLLTVNTNFDVASLDVIEVAPPTTGGNGGNGGSPPPPVNAPPVASGSFELGGQSHSFANPQLMASAGMNWIKFQHKWGGPNDDPAGVAGRIQQAHANGFKVLLSIPGQVYPQSINFEAYVDFLGGVAALGPNAIEVWNEQNIDFEWPVGQIDPASYVNNMLAPAYNRIKSVNPNVMVISGAPAPTGYFGGGCSPNGCDDSAYLAGMRAAGAANYMDCVGVHFNAGATSPHQSSGHPAGNDHYSWHLRPMINVYDIFGKPLCFTELGYLSGQDYGGVPSRFSWAAGTTVQQHAQWLAEAVSISANSGRVRMIIVFNVDFTHFGEDPQAGYAMIRSDGSCPACETLRQVMGR
ncbi:MAG: SH3 domain-containing protein [Chloroflexota bacterium]